MDRNGKQLGLLGEPGNIDDIQFSPDGGGWRPRCRQEYSHQTDIWIYECQRGLRSRFTFDPSINFGPVWSPDGRSIIFVSRRKQHFDLYRKSSDGAGAEELLYSDNLDKAPTKLVSGWQVSSVYASKFDGSDIED